MLPARSRLRNSGVGKGSAVPGEQKNRRRQVDYDCGLHKAESGGKDRSGKQLPPI